MSNIEKDEIKTKSVRINLKETNKEKVKISKAGADKNSLDYYHVPRPDTTGNLGESPFVGIPTEDIVGPLMSSIPAKVHVGAEAELGPDEVATTPLHPHISELTDNDDISVASMSSFSVRSHGNLRHPNYHESLLHVPSSELPRVMYMNGIPTTNLRREDSRDSSNLGNGSNNSTVAPSLSSSVTVINATLVEEDPEEQNSDEDGDSSGEQQDDPIMRTAQVVALAVATKEKNQKWPLDCKDRRVQIFVFIPLVLLVGLAVALAVVLTSDRTNNLSKPTDTGSSPSPTEDLMKGGPPQHEWDKLRNTLSLFGSDLYGPVIDNQYLQTCEVFDSNPYRTAETHQCLQFLECRFELCSLGLNARSNMPSFVATVRSEKAIEEAILFANKHNIPISIKTSGWSFTGSSTTYGSLMLLMNKFPKEGGIINGYKNSCGSSFQSVVTVGGGEWIDDVIEELGENNCPTFLPYTRAISAAGGFLQGGGITTHSRLNGLAIDQVIDFRVTLANGTSVLVDRCTNEELFWAFRGGGGGTFGVVTKVHYKIDQEVIHPFVLLSFSIQGREAALKNGEADDFTKAVETWLRFWIEKSPYLDRRWNGYFGSTFCLLYFFGPEEDAVFVQEIRDWYNNNIDIFTYNNTNWGAFSPKIENHSNWYHHKGGSSAYRNPLYVAETYATDIRNMSSRLVTHEEVTSEPEDTLKFLMQLSLNGTTWDTPNFLLGGKISDVSVNDTSVHPVIRRSVWGIYIYNYEGQMLLKNHFKGKKAAAVPNWPSIEERNWKEVQWGSNYERLNLIKNKYDPDGVFKCYHCVGYDGPEFPSN